MLSGLPTASLGLSLSCYLLGPHPCGMGQQRACGAVRADALRLTKNGKRAIERAMREQDCQDAGRRRQDKDGPS